MPRLITTNLTDTIARAAKPRIKRYDIFDARVRGMGLRVATSGTKSWFVMRRINGRMTRKVIGRYPELSLAEARVQAASRLAEMARGDMPDPHRSRDFEKMLDEWLKRDQGRNRSVRQVRNAVDLYVRPALKRRHLDEITKADINRIIDAITARGVGVQANRVLSFLRRFFNWCIERDYLTVNPTTGIPKPYREKSRERTLSLKELARVRGAAETMGYPFGPLFQILMLTGQRRDEVARVTWDEIDLEDGRWTIPGARSKKRDILMSFI